LLHPDTPSQPFGQTIDASQKGPGQVIAEELFPGIKGLNPAKIHCQSITKGTNPTTCHSFSHSFISPSTEYLPHIN
jgi:hypothetical protein